ncbi:HAD family hydrolase [Thiohalophilus thiocyanatoxydans]|uniref:HAD superfamily hydrolase (TIGR01509 family) n=1 Tax=Thiohalophilus thiocyanatoxydans TaxID=381308 RepID=A0A4R8IXH0_9GAMM|nr:HAD family hydrolase [Thiohalophilus thiocyanatoxydans]TDY02597.1 HAD superfamily hydrolase (TIGR01509 family) [Thiohalophilus thiocyanatoxydans]
MAELAALLFDVDGTLSNTERDGHRVAFNRAFAEAGLDWEWDVATYGALLSITGGKERMRHYLEQYQPAATLPGDPTEWIAELHQAKTRHYETLLGEGGIPLRPGVERLLREAREAGYRLAIATTTTPANVTALLENAVGPDALQWFEVIAAGDVVPAKKPAPDIYEYAMAKMGLEPARCIAFEDSHNGILASKGAGLKTIITVNDYTRDHDFDNAELVLDSFGEPQQPFRVLSGSSSVIDGARYLDMALVKRVHAG